MPPVPCSPLALVPLTALWPNCARAHNSCIQVKVELEWFFAWQLQHLDQGCPKVSQHVGCCHGCAAQRRSALPPKHELHAKVLNNLLLLRHGVQD